MLRGQGGSCLCGTLGKGYRLFLGLKVKVLVTLSCPTLCNPMDCSPPVSSVHRILQARLLEWVTISFSRGSFQPRNRTWVSRIAGRFFTVWATKDQIFKVECFRRALMWILWRFSLLRTFPSFVGDISQKGHWRLLSWSLGIHLQPSSSFLLRSLHSSRQWSRAGSETIFC